MVGLKSAWAQGAKSGRRRLMAPADLVPAKELLARPGLKAADVAAMLKVSERTLFRELRAARDARSGRLIAPSSRRSQQSPGESRGPGQEPGSLDHTRARFLAPHVRLPSTFFWNVPPSCSRRARTCLSNSVSASATAQTNTPASSQNESSLCPLPSFALLPVSPFVQGQPDDDPAEDEQQQDDARAQHVGIVDDHPRLRAGCSGSFICTGPAGCWPSRRRDRSRRGFRRSSRRHRRGS